MTVQRIVLRWMGSHGRPRWIRIPFWVPVLPIALLAVCAIALWVLWHSPWSPRLLQSRLEQLRQVNLGLESQQARAEEGLNRAQAALDGAKSQRDRYRELSGTVPEDGDSKETESRGFLGSIFGPNRRTETADASHLLERSRIDRQRWDGLIKSLEKRPSLAARLPTIRPVRADAPEVEAFSRIRDPFTGHPMNTQGIAWGVPLGTPVWATGAGRVIDVTQLARWGKVVEIDHGSGIRTMYCHLSQSTVRIGDLVLRGQVVGLSGESGTTIGPRIFYAVFQGTKARTPADFILPEIPGDTTGSQDPLVGRI